MTAFVQVYSKSPIALSPAGHAMGLGIPANTFTGLLLLGAVVFGIFTTLGGIWADKLGRRTWLLWVTAGIVVLGLFMPAFLNQGTVLSVAAFIVVGMAVMGMTFGPMAALLPELFPTEVRYSGASLAYNLSSIVGASIPTLVAMELNKSYGLWGVGLYMAANGVITMLALYLSRETRDLDMSDSATLAR
jgi:MFS family permease